MFHCRWSKLEMRKSSNSSEFETNYAFSDGQVIFDANWRFLVSRCIVHWNGIYETTEWISTKSLVRRNINVSRHQHKNGERNDSVCSETMKIKVISPPERKYSILIEGQNCFSSKLKHISLMNEKKWRRDCFSLCWLWISNVAIRFVILCIFSLSFFSFQHFLSCGIFQWMKKEKHKIIIHR